MTGTVKMARYEYQIPKYLKKNPKKFENMVNIILKIPFSHPKTLFQCLKACTAIYVLFMCRPFYKKLFKRVKNNASQVGPQIPNIDAPRPKICTLRV